MLKTDRFLLAILAGLIILAIIALVVVLSYQQSEQVFDSSSPEYVVQRYVLAIQAADWEQAYGFLADLEGKPTLAEFQRAWLSQGSYSNRASLRIGTSLVVDDEATVSLTVLNAYRGPFFFDRVDERPDAARLVRGEGGWGIAQMPWEFWQGNWYEEYLYPAIKAPQRIHSD